MLDEHHPATPEPFDAANSGSPAIPVARPIGPPSPDPADTRTPDLLLLSSTPKSMVADIAIVLASMVLMELCVGTLFFLFSDMTSLTEEADQAALEKSLLIPALAVRTAATLAIITFILRRRGQTARSIGLQWPGVGWDVLIGLGAAAGASAFIMVWQLTMLSIWPELIEEMNRN
ncbi:MAG: hypothetical protein KJ749_01905, partial [Planctomycetes bacterium]|nr:hypothetical protein [Planctomycetota bacterium]